MTEVIIKNVVDIVAALIITLAGVLGAWLSAKIAKRAELDSINTATQQLISATQITVGELQQTLVEGMKEAAEDGKLTTEDMMMLGNMLIEKTMKKMSKPACDLLNAAGVDIIAMINGAGEDWINSLKK